MCLYFGGFTGMYSETALNIALPQLSLAFGVELNMVQWLVVAYMLVIGLILPFASLLMKWFTARQITLFALCSFLIGALISGFAGSFENMPCRSVHTGHWHRIGSTTNVRHGS